MLVETVLTEGKCIFDIYFLRYVLHLIDICLLGLLSHFIMFTSRKFFILINL